jgi:hypothetical protein
MSWFRSNGQKVAMLGLFALACQLLVSFGHIHITRWSIDASGLAVSSGIVAGCEVVRPASPQKLPAGFADEFCAICASVGMASALIVPDYPLLVVPTSFVDVMPLVSAKRAASAFEHLSFRARAPPLT